MDLVRRALLAVSRNRWLGDQLARRRFTRRAVSRFMPGEELESALDAAVELAEDGIASVFTYLGEDVTERGKAGRVASHYLDGLDRLSSRGLDGQVSVKLTQLGLSVDAGEAEANLARIVKHAAGVSRFVWIDMESSTHTDVTLEIFRRLRPDHPNLGVCLQAYLHRTPEDLDSLVPLRPAIRLVKGAYSEPPELAFQSKSDVDRRYLELGTQLLDLARTGGARPAFGTHDANLVDALIERAGALAPADYEFQMLYGIRRDLWQRLIAAGHRVRVLISYGEEWFPWFMRRLAERPANLLFVLRNVLA